MLRKFAPLYRLSIATALMFAVGSLVPAQATSLVRAPASVAVRAAVPARPLVLAPLAPLSNAITEVRIVPRASGVKDTPQVFIAEVSPITATTPITYVWSATDQSVITQTGGITNVVVFTWTTSGEKVITVTADNGLSSVQVTRTHIVTDHFVLNILHTNDVHGRVFQYTSNNLSTPCIITPTLSNCISGAPRLSTLIQQKRQTENNVLLLDAGDQFQGTLFYKLFKSHVITTVMNALGYDAMAIGNHEFDDGQEELAALFDTAAFPVLSANINASASPTLANKIKPSVVITVNGEPVGIVGLTTPDTQFLVSPSSVQGVVFSNTTTALQNAVNDLVAQGIDRIIALTHVGYADDLALAQVITGVDVIVGGHSHTFLHPSHPTTVNGDTSAGPYPTVVTAPDGHPVLVVQAFQWARYLGDLKVTFSPTGTVLGWSGGPIFVGNVITPDLTVQNILTPTFVTPIISLLNTFVGTTTVAMPLNVSGVLTCRRTECLLGNLVTDAMLWKVNSLIPDPNDHFQIAIQNGGGLRAPIDAGPVSVGEVLELLPFGNTIATFELTGTHIISSLESGLSNFGVSGDGRFPQVAGLRYKFDPTRPPGSRLISVEVRLPDNTFAPISPTVRYRVVSNNFMRTGGDGYTLFRDAAINPYDFGPQLEEAVIEYLQAFSPITPTFENRVQWDRLYAYSARSLLAANGISTTTLTIAAWNFFGVPLQGQSVQILPSAGAVSPASGAINNAARFALTSTGPSTLPVLTAPLDAGNATVFVQIGSQTLSFPITYYQDATTVNFASTALTQSAAVATAGSVLTYAYTVTNSGPGNATGVALVVPIPAGTQYVSGSVSGGTYIGSFSAFSTQAPQAVVTWQGNIPAGGQHVLSFAVRPTILRGVLTNTLSVMLNDAVIFSGSQNTEVVPASEIYLPIVRR